MNAEIEKQVPSFYSKNDEILKRLKSSFSQSFSNLEKTYQFSSKTKKLVETGVRDVQAEIESHRECALDVMLDKFLDPTAQRPYQLVDGITDVHAIDLIDLSDIAVKKEELCIKYGLSPNASLFEIQDVITAKIKESEAKINEKNEIKKENE